LQERLIDNNIGGMCYEISELLRCLLISVGYEVSIFRTWVLNNKPFNDDHPPSHNILCVQLYDKSYLVDAAFGYNSLRAPVEFDQTCNYKEF
jgi:arylamine N-acetyltransferase